MEVHEPNNPTRTTLAAIISLEQRHPGKYCCEPKGDGWRSHMYLPYGGTWTRHAKYSRGEQAKTPLPSYLIKQLEGLEMPEGTAFDCEWMGPRSVKDTGGQHWLTFYDILYFNGQWQGDLPYRERKSLMTTLLNLYKARAERAGKPHGNLLVTDYVEENFLQCYMDQKPENAGNELSEGIVVKGWDSKLLVRGGDNPDWFKVRYRG